MNRFFLRLLLLFYDLLFVLLSPLILLYLLSRKDSRKRLTEYLGLPSVKARKSAAKGCLLVHAVSVGEVLSVVPIVEKLKEEMDLPVILSTTIDDAETISKKVPGVFTATTFMSLDFSPFVRFFLKNLKPHAVIISETDLWPNFLSLCKDQLIPLYLTNGRLSHKISRGAFSLGGLASEIFLSFQHLFVQRDQDSHNLMATGLPKGRISVAGNTKYESAAKILAASEETARVIKSLPELDRPILVGGSTHPGEEKLLLELFITMRRTPPLLVIAPRIIGRADEIIALCDEQKLFSKKWTALKDVEDLSTAMAELDVLVVDVLGELVHLYECADVVFMGGTFGKVGGHNFLEACTYSKAIIVGPDVRNFSQDLELFLKKNALVLVNEKETFLREVRLLLEDKEAATDMGRRARAILDDNQGAASNIAKHIIDDLRALAPRTIGGKVGTG